MRLEERIKVMREVAKWLDGSMKSEANPQIAAWLEKWDGAVMREHFHHSWFIPEFVREAASALSRMILGEDGHALERWLEPYRPALEAHAGGRRVGVIMAGNIPLVAFHDFLCVFMAGDRFVGKMSSHDTRLWPLLFGLLEIISPEAARQAELVQGPWGGVDAVIATGSDNSSRYFEYYFGKLPHIIRGHCNGVAVLDGGESSEELHGLAKDICLYFGMGCRNVSKIFVPQGYDFAPLFAALDDFRPQLAFHHSYLNNLEYQKTVHLINSIPFLDQGICMFKENGAVSSPIGVTHYAFYNNLEDVWPQLSGPEVQCVVSRLQGEGVDTVPPGMSQYPALGQYANGVDTMKFLLS